MAVIGCREVIPIAAFCHADFLCLIYLYCDGHPPVEVLPPRRRGRLDHAGGDLLGIAQPALSRQVQLLEEDLGVTLFHRTRRGVQLTEEGERLRSSTAAPLRQFELAVQYAAFAVGTTRARHAPRLAGHRCRRLGGAADRQPDGACFRRRVSP